MERFKMIRKESVTLSKSTKKPNKIVKIGSKKYVIESGIAIPGRRADYKETKWKKIIAEMDVGDSVVVDTEIDAGCLRSAAKTKQKMTSQKAIKVEVKKGRQVKTVTKYRVWRVE